MTELLTVSVECPDYSKTTSNLLLFYKAQLSQELKDIAYKITSLQPFFMSIARDSERANELTSIDNRMKALAILMRNYKILSEKLRYINEVLQSRN